MYAHNHICPSHLCYSPTHQLSNSHTHTFQLVHIHMNTTHIRLSLTQSPHKCRLAHTYKEVLTNTCLEALIHTPKPLCTHTLSQHTSTRTQTLKHTHTYKFSHSLTHTRPYKRMQSFRTSSRRLHQNNLQIFLLHFFFSASFKKL